MLLIFNISVPGFAEVEKVEFNNQHTVRIATSKDDDSFYLTRLGPSVDCNFFYLNKAIRISPFFEYQHNLETNSSWRKELGAEIGSSFFNDCFYWGTSFQHVWQDEENYSVESLEETTEWESRFVITPPIQWGIFKDRLKLRLFDEYTYDFTRGQGTFNEMGVTLDWQIRKGIKMPIGWRHTDRIHDFDSDAIELSVLFSF